MVRRLTLIPVLIVAAACGSPGDEARSPERPRPVSVQVAPALGGSRVARLEAGGVVAASATAVLSSRVVAPVLAVAVRAGDRVRTGDVLVRLDAREMTAHVRQADAASRAAEDALTAARSAQAAATAEHKLAIAWHARIAQLRERNSATAHELDEAEARLAATAARNSAAQASVEQATAQLGALRAAADAAGIAETYGVIRAPFDGVVTERLIDPGSLAAPGLPLLRIDASGSRRVDLRVDEARAVYINRGDRATVLLDGESAEQSLEGTVVEVARAINADQRAFTVKVTLPRGSDPRTGTFARVRFDGQRRAAIIVPATAVRSQGQLTSVFVASNGVARIRLVQTGDTAADGTDIVSGLDAGEMVVARPPPGLSDGQPITIEPATAPRRTPDRTSDVEGASR